jgi:hypothetical protein
MMNDIEVIECERPTNLEEIAKFESLINAKLPEDYKQFLLKYNGGHPVYDGYRLVKPINEKTNEAGIDWFYALYDGDVCNISKQFYRSREELPEEVIPIGSDSGGKVCLGIAGEYYGQVYYWTTNWSFWKEEDLNYLFLIANSFTEFVNKLFEIKADGKGNFIRRYQDGTVTVTPE